MSLTQYRPRSSARFCTTWSAARAAALAGSLALLAACADSPSAPLAVPAALSVVAGSNQSATVGSTLPTALTVEVTTAQGAPVAGRTVSFAVTSGSGTVAPTAATTDADGRASTQLTLGTTVGTVRVTASVQGA